MQQSGGERPVQGARDWLARARALCRRFALSLRGQIVMLVLAAIGITSLLAAWTSTETIHRYLDERIEEQFPALLSAKDRELDLWYQQARLDLSTFARSETLGQNVPRVGAGDEAALAEMRTYLEYIRGQFARYRTLYLLDARGDVLLRSGEEVPLPAALRDGHGGLEQARLHPVTRIAGRRIQVASAPVAGTAGASLHAVVDLSALDAMLAAGVEREATDVYLADAEGAFVAGTLEVDPATFNLAGPDPTGAPTVQTYINGLGERVVGGARPVESLGWTLVVEQDYEVAFEPIGALVARVVWGDLLIGLVLVAVAIRVVVSVTRPVGDLSRAAQAVADGDTDVRIDEPRGATELVQLTRAFNQMTHHLGIQRQALERQNEELQRLSLTDPLTGLFNRRYLEDQLPREIKRVDRLQQRLALAVLDIDDFKRVNDTWGHALGDRVLCAVAAALTAELRATDLLARYGGEEFIVLSQHLDAGGAATLAEKLRAAVAAIEPPLPADEDGAPPRRITVSVGLALHGDDAERLFRDADAALYRAKGEGKDRVTVAADPVAPQTSPKKKRARSKVKAGSSAARRKSSRPGRSA